MLLQLASHRWVWWLEGSLALLLGLLLLTLRGQMQNPLFTPLAAAIAVAASGLVILIAGALDLEIAIQMATEGGHWKLATGWWLKGMIGFALGITIFLMPELNMRWLAGFAALQALVTATVSLVTLPAVRRHRRERWLLMFGSFGCTALAALLVSGALASEAASTRALGTYAVFFGGRLLLIGAEFSMSRLPKLKLLRSTHTA